MKLLANENIPAALTRSLRAAGHDVNWVSEISPGITDTQVIELAIQQDRILVTFDKDFGELAFRRSLPATCGIILLRLPMDDLNRLIRMVVEETRFDFARCHQCEGFSELSEQQLAFVNNRFFRC